MLWAFPVQPFLYIVWLVQCFANVQTFSENAFAMLFPFSNLRKWPHQLGSFCVDIKGIMMKKCSLFRWWLAWTGWWPINMQAHQMTRLSIRRSRFLPLLPDSLLKSFSFPNKQKDNRNLRYVCLSHDYIGLNCFNDQEIVKRLCFWSRAVICFPPHKVDWWKLHSSSFNAEGVAETL